MASFLDHDSRTSPSRLRSRGSTVLGTIGMAALAAMCLAATSWPILESVLLIDQLRWKYVRWGLVLDEQNNYTQILYFLRGRYEIFRWPGETYPGIAVFPGFHVLMAALGQATGLSSPRVFRVYGFGISLVF